MQQLRELVREEVRFSQDALAELLLIHPDEDRTEIVPALSLRQLADNPAERQPGWSFLQHPQNTSLHGHERWLLRRVLNNEWLRKDFVTTHSSVVSSRRKFAFRRDAIEQYYQSVDRFLERLLLLAHITGGQPARGTELLCLTYSNSEDGSRHRSIFLENGLVSFVTSYHKGYNITGSTKIIHRYLPIAVSELVGRFESVNGEQATRANHAAQYQANTRAPLRRATDADIRKDTAMGSWPAQRLSTVLGSTFYTHVKTKVNIQTWRHAAIAISRRHLHQAKFKRDFIEAVSWAWNDEMAAHGSKIAGLTYARGLEEAPGHVAGAKAEYRRISREWHAWLGLGGYQSQRQENQEPCRCHKRTLSRSVDEEAIHGKRQRKDKGFV
ncbi:hypothetical protein CSUB01_12491 [Colletotrichum sublineola]|uniref:Uncharacterized protein n=1 Tax=Colletotrichum sublineola TaxID=1173701 RepID=A0A066X8E0_COLSU|nr:hypothetical protein CSUB01_12491 [Colletotrichum sublineola]